MYILIHKGFNGFHFTDICSKHKKNLVRHLKDLGYRYSKAHGIYINDTKEKEGDVDYVIEKIEEI